jgi:hypothetical protein
MCLNETYSRVQVGKHLSDRFLIKNDLKQRDAFLPPLFNFCLRICHLEGSDKSRGLEMK